MLRIALSAVVGAVILMVWGFISWGVMNMPGLRAFEDESAAGTALKAAAPEEGAYFIPFQPDNPTDATALDAWKAQHQEGPVGLVLIRPDGEAPMSAMTLAYGFLNYLASSLLATLLLVAALPRLHGFISKVAFMTSLGLLSWLIADRTYQIFLYFPDDYIRSILFDRLIGWALFGVFAAAVIKGGPKT